MGVIKICCLGLICCHVCVKNVSKIDKKSRKRALLPSKYDVRRKTKGRDAYNAINLVDVVIGIWP